MRNGPRALVSNVVRSLIVEDRFKVFLASADVGGGDLEASKLDSVLSKYKFFRIEEYAIVAAGVQPVNRLEEATFDVI